ncbi:MAG: N-acetylmuramoyl-L-alanine amidase [Syntrophomonadaceae bacterium]|nr:N-acetylmuramoyl-L-alanine amidase [Syntrophomonadaceae bacterium]
MLLVILLNLFFFSFLLSASAATGIINIDNVNIRSGPDTTYDVVGMLNQGTGVEILGSEKNWYQIKTEQFNGWVRNDLINLQKEYQVEVTVNGVNLRSGPGTNYDIVGSANQGEILTLLDVNGDWYQVKTSAGLPAYIKATFTEKAEKATPVPVVSQPAPVASTAVSQVEVISGNVYLRSGPGPNFDNVGSVSGGDILSVLGQEGDWYKIKKADGSSAYIAGWLVHSTNAAVPTLATPNSNPAAVPALAIPNSNPAGVPQVIFDGRQLTFEVPPIIENGRTLVPLRAIFEAMGASVSWDNNTRTATSVKGTTTVVLPIGSTRPTVNGQVWPLEVPGKIVKNRTLVPLRFVGEAFGGKVDWNNSTRIITITSPASTGSRASSLVIRDNNTNLHSGPATTYDAVDSASQGEKLAILAQRDGWYQVSRGGRTAWVAGWVVYLDGEGNEPLSPEKPIEEPKPESPPKPQKPSPGVIWLSLDADENGLQIVMESGAKLDADIRESSSTVTYEFKNRQIEGLNLVKQPLGSGEIKAKARNVGDNTIVEIEFPYNTQYQTASEEGGKREVFIISNSILDVQRKSIGSSGERLVIKTLTPAQFSRSKSGEIIEVRLEGVQKGRAQDDYQFNDSNLINNITFREIPGKTGGTSTIIRVTTSGDLGKYTVGQSTDGRDINILLVNQGQIKARRDNLVVLDPGHGGKDTGARGANINEKDVNLKIALKAGELLKQKGIEVEYTRNTDIYLELTKDRDEISEIANRLNPALFVSIHSNGVPGNSAAQGTETYYYAPVENDLLFLQLDERKSLAENLQRQLIAKLKRPDRGVKQNSYWVLKHTTMPSALVEVAFLSNPEEESLLQQEYFLDLAAQAIADGIAAYMGK